MTMGYRAALLIAAALLAAPAAADVKAGVDAWARGDYATAVVEWQAPARSGDADAQFNLGQAYKLGRGVPTDLGAAEHWYRLAAIQGHPQAEDNYGLALFQNGKRGEALPWLQKSAARGEARAQFVLGTMYFNGDAVQKDWVRAYALVTRASQAGLPQATQTLDQMNRYIPLEDRQAGIALAKKDGPALLGTAPVRTAAAQPPRRRGAITTTELPPSDAYRSDPGYDAPVETAATPEPHSYREPVAPRPAPTPPSPRPAPEPVAASAPTPAVAPAGRWRIQLGAFGEPGNARKLWASIPARVPALRDKTAYYEAAGRLTKLQVGPFASSSDASRACAAAKAAGQACLTVGP